MNANQRPAMTESKVDDVDVLDNIEQVFGRKSKTYAAVAELIEAAKLGGDMPKRDGSEHAGMFFTATNAARLRAALAACTPAKSEGR